MMFDVDDEHMCSEEGLLGCSDDDDRNDDTDDDDDDWNDDDDGDQGCSEEGVDWVCQGRQSTPMHSLFLLHSGDDDNDYE